MFNYIRPTMTNRTLQDIVRNRVRTNRRHGPGRRRHNDVGEGFGERQTIFERVTNWVPPRVVELRASSSWRSALPHFSPTRSPVQAP